MQQIVFAGYGSTKNLSALLEQFSPQKIFLVTGRNSYEQSGAADRIQPILGETAQVRFFDFEINPTLVDIEKGLELFKKENCDFIIGVGGGSVMDIAKAIAFLFSQQAVPEDVVKGVVALTPRRIPIVMIPTTAGSGSESTQFSVVYIDGKKFSLTHESLLPDFAILDPTFTLSLPSYTTACSGIDALCQGIESLWSVNSTKNSRLLSLRSIKLAVSNLAKAVNEPDEDSREEMLKASNLAGCAINVARTTAAHSVSYPLTSIFGIVHGHAVALTLPNFIEFNSGICRENCQDRRGVRFVQDRMRELADALGVPSPKAGREKIIDLMQQIQLQTRLSKLGIVEGDLEVVVKNGFNPQRIINNPRKISATDLREILMKAF